MDGRSQVHLDDGAAYVYRDVVSPVALWEGEHNDLCGVCGDGGELICCSFCSNVCHMACAAPALTRVPEGDWACGSCARAQRAAAATAETKREVQVPMRPEPDNETLAEFVVRQLERDGGGAYWARLRLSPAKR